MLSLKGEVRFGMPIGLMGYTWALSLSLAVSYNDIVYLYLAVVWFPPIGTNDFPCLEFQKMSYWFLLFHTNFNNLNSPMCAAHMSRQFFSSLRVLFKVFERVNITNKRPIDGQTHQTKNFEANLCFICQKIALFYLNRQGTEGLPISLKKLDWTDGQKNIYS